MNLFGRSKEPSLPKEALLASKPVLNSLVDWSVTEGGEVRIEVPRRDAWWVKFVSILVRPPANRAIGLDEIGSKVWHWASEGFTVRVMIDKLSKAHKLNRREAEASLLAYLKILAKKNLIGFEVPRQRAGSTEGGRV